MPVPNSVKNLLELENVRYNLTSLTLQNYRRPDSGATASCIAVRSTILKDELGQLQVLFPADCLLDLNALNHLLARRLCVASRDDLRPFYERHQLESVPALPKLSGFPTIVDEGLFGVDSLLLDSGTSDEMVQIEQADFQRLLGDVIRGRFCIVVDELESASAKQQPGKAHSAVSKFTATRTLQRLEETLELPLLPSTARRIIGLYADPNADVDDLAEVVETDPSLAAQVVSWATSPYYSSHGNVKSIHDAIVRVLGYDMVMKLALGLTLDRALHLPQDYPDCVGPYCQQALYTATTMEALATITSRGEPLCGLAYLSGLLHNFGYLIMAEVFPPYFDTVSRYLDANPHVPASLIEQHLIGVTRDQLASSLTKLWSLPEPVETALRFQNQPDYDGKHSVYAKLLFVATAKLRERGMGSGPWTDIPQSVYEDLGVNPEQVDTTVQTVMESIEELNEVAQRLASA